MTAVVIGYLVGVLPAPASATIDHCYVTYDRQERQYSRCVAHWTRAGRDVRGLVHGVPVGTGWQALTTDPDDTYEWEVSVPDAHRRQDVLTVLTHGWVVPRFVQVSLALAVVASLGFLGWLARRRPRRRQA